jgi:nitrite reductase (NADH) small subunit
LVIGYGAMRRFFKIQTMETISATRWFYACRAEDVPANGGVCVQSGQEQIALFNFTRRGEWYATQNLCPHKQQMVLSRGMIGSAGPACEPKIACPFHKRTFSLLTGENLEGEAYTIRTYPVRVQEGRVYIGVEDQVRRPGPYD